MKKAVAHIVVLVFFLFYTVAAVDAQTSPEVVKKAFNVRPGGRLTLNSELGMIDVKATNRNRVDVVFTKSLKSGSNIKIGGLTSLEIDRLVREAFTDFEATFEQKGSNVSITGKFKRGWEYWLRRSQHMSLLLLTKVKIEFKVTVPRRYDVNLTAADSANIHVGNIGGEVIAETGWGDIQLGSVAGTVNAKTGSGGGITLKSCQSKVDAITDFGDIQLGSVSGAVNAQTGSGGGIEVGNAASAVIAKTDFGDIQLGNVSGAVNAKTGSGGDIKVGNAASAVIAKTDFGDIQLGNVAGTVNANTGSGGSITLKSCQSRVDALTDFGDIQLGSVSGAVNAKTGSGGDIEVGNAASAVIAKTDFGEIVVSLIPTIAVDIDAVSGSGRVSSDFPVRGSKSENSLKGTINGGGPLLKLRASSGDIRLLRKGR